MVFFGFAGIRKVPEGFRKLVRKLTLASQHHRSSGRCPEACPEACFFFVCVSAIPEDSGRFPEACPEACLNTSVYCIPEDSGRLPEDLAEGVQNTKPWF